MMKLLRFMSTKEAFDLIHNRRILTNDTDHSKEHGSRTDSIGFCFLPVVADTIMGEKEAIYNSAKFLSGIATLDCVLIATAKPDFASSLKRRTGYYSVGTVLEYSIEQYSIDMFSSYNLYAPKQEAHSFIRGSSSYEDCTLTVSKRYGDKNLMVKYTKDDIDRCIKYKKQGMSLREVADKAGVRHPQTVKNLLQRGGYFK